MPTYMVITLIACPVLGVVAASRVSFIPDEVGFIIGMLAAGIVLYLWKR